MKDDLKDSLVVIHTADNLLKVCPDVDVLIRDTRNRIVQYLNAQKIIIYAAFYEQNIRELPQKIFNGINGINFISPSGDVRLNQEKLDLRKQAKNIIYFLVKYPKVYKKTIEVVGMHRYACVRKISEGLVSGGFDVEINEQLCR